MYNIYISFVLERLKVFKFTGRISDIYPVYDRIGIEKNQLETTFHPILVAFKNNKVYGVKYSVSLDFSEVLA